MYKVSWREVGLSTILFGFVVAFFLFFIHQLVSVDVGVWTGNFLGTQAREGVGSTMYTHIPVADVGDVVVRVRFPHEPRYDSGAPVIVSIPPFFTPDQKAFQELPGLSDYGFVQVSFLLPGRKDRETDLGSDGAVDYGGAHSVAALRDVLLYAGGEKADIYGEYIYERITSDVDTSVLGAYAFSHSGILLFQTLAQYGDILPVDFVVGQENPTEPVLSALELGYFDKGRGLVNTLYAPADHYRDDGILFPYSTIAWDAQGERPYFDVNEDGIARKDDDVLLGSQVPGMFGKRVYSPELLSALWENERFTLLTWPQDVATPDEARLWWGERNALSAFASVGNMMPDLRVMLLFGKEDHAQPAPDKPHIRQAYAGLVGAGLWVRLNPDAAYVAVFDEQLAADYREHPAGSGPTSWEAEAFSWAHADGAGAARVMPFAALAEMADRTAVGVWEGDLYRILTPDTE